MGAYYLCRFCYGQGRGESGQPCLYCKSEEERVLRLRTESEESKTTQATLETELAQALARAEREGE
jgi:hypothetical protein